MRFICPEIESEISLSDQVLQLYGMENIPKEYQTDIDGNALQRLICATRYDSGQVKSRSFLYGRQEVMAKYFQSYPYAPSTQRTIAQLASNTGISIDKNFSDSADYYFHFRAFIDSTAPFRTNLWYTVFTDNGLYFAQPVRRSGAMQMTAFTVVSTVEREDFFDNPGYTGDTLKNFLLSGDYSTVVPAAMNSTQKTRVLNKYRSQNGIVKIWSGKNDVLPCDYFITGGKVYVVLSKKDLRNGMYEYVGVRETSGSYTFGVTDDNYNVRPYAYVPVMVDQWHYVGASGEPAFVNSWANFGGQYQVARFKIDGNRFVHIEGLVKSGTNSIIFTLPVGYRPTSYTKTKVNLHYNAGTHNVSWVAIATSGEVQVSTAKGTTYVTIDIIFGID